MVDPGMVAEIAETFEFCGALDLRRVVACIESHLEADLSLSELAGVVGMSVFRFVRAFKAATGQPPHRHLMQAH